MLLFTMWEDSVHYEGGRFVNVDGDGRRTEITERRAREMERSYLDYQAIQAFQRGGGFSLEAERCMRGLRDAPLDKDQWVMRLAAKAKTHRAV